MLIGNARYQWLKLGNEWSDSKCEMHIISALVRYYGGSLALPWWLGSWFSSSFFCPFYYGLLVFDSFIIILLIFIWARSHRYNIQYIFRLWSLKAQIVYGKLEDIFRILRFDYGVSFIFFNHMSCQCLVLDGKYYFGFFLTLFALCQSSDIWNSHTISCSL